MVLLEPGVNACQIGEMLGFDFHNSIWSHSTSFFSRFYRSDVHHIELKSIFFIIPCFEGSQMLLDISRYLGDVEDVLILIGEKPLGNR